MSNKYDRQMQIFNMLAKGGRLTYSRIAHTFGVSIKTIKQDITDLSLHFPIITFCGRYGGVELSRGYSVGGYLMAPRHVEAITRALERYIREIDDQDAREVLYTLKRR